MMNKIKGVKLGWQAWCGVIAIEIILMCVCCSVYGNREPVDFFFAQGDLCYESGESGFYLDKSHNHQYTATPEFVLPKGLYTVEAQYERSDKSAWEIAAEMEAQYANERHNEYDNELSGKIILLDSAKVSFDFRVKYSDRPIQVRGSLTPGATDDDYILIKNVHIVSSAANMRNTLFRLLMVFLTVDLLLFLYNLKDRFNISGEMKNHIKLLALLIIVSSIPLMVNYLFRGAHDLRFHLTRIEGIKEGLQYGMFPVKIQPSWLAGNGYAVSVFYGDLFLYIPALLRILGISIQASYQFYVLLVNIATVLAAYYCFCGMSNAKTGLVCTVVYTLNIYRLVCIYTRAAVGEYTAMTFIPLVLYGLWKIYMLPEGSKMHEKSWITITVGCVGIFFSHIITTEMIAFFVIIAAVIMWRKTFRKKTLLVLCKAAAATVLLTCWFLGPLLDYMINETFAVNSPNSFEAYLMENRSVYLAQLFIIEYNVKGGSTNFLEGIRNEMPLTVGLSALSALALWFYLCAGKKERDKSERKTEYLAVFLCLLSLMLATWLFPYTWLVARFQVLADIVSSIQYPWRFFSIAGIMLAYLVCLILQKDWIDINKKKLFAGLLFALSFSQGLLYMSKCLSEYSPYHVYQSGNLSTYDVIGGEYFPENSEVSGNEAGCVNELTFNPDVLNVRNWHRDGGAVEVSLTNHSDSTQQMEAPLLLYKGYHAITDSGDELVISPGESYRISVAIPANFDGTIRVEFREPWYWRICELISLIALIWLVLHPFMRKYIKKTVYDGACENLMVDS